MLSSRSSQAIPIRSKNVTIRCSFRSFHAGAINALLLQIRILAALVLVNCTIAVGDLKGGEDASDVRVPMPPPSPSSFAGSEDLEDGTPQALDAVIDHRVLQLFVRTLRSWASLPVLPSSCSPEPAAMDCPACDYAGAIARATQDVAERRTPQRLREAVAFGVVDALIAWLRRARMVEIAGMGTPVLSLSEVEDQHSSRAHSRVAPSSTGRASATGVTPTGVASALSALAALCANCDEARERVVALEFHYSLDFWLRATDPNKQSAWRDDDSLEDELESQDGGMGCDSVVCSALELVRNLGRSSVACSALAGAGVHLSLISHYLLASEEEGEEEEEEEEEYSKAQAVASLAAAGLANMSLEHGVVKEAITSSECLQRACDFAVDEDVDEEVSSARAVLQHGEGRKPCRSPPPARPPARPRRSHRALRGSPARENAISARDSKRARKRQCSSL